MASINVPEVLVYLTTLDGLNYYYADQNTDGTYIVGSSTSQKAIMNLPIGWERARTKWGRHPVYLGIFRSQSEEFSFVEDARAILLSLYYATGGWVQAKCKLRIDVLKNMNDGYGVAHQSEIDFASAEDMKYNAGYTGIGGYPVRDGELNVSTLDSRTWLLLEALESTAFNIPVWKAAGGSWELDGADIVKHNGLKLLYQANYTSSAKMDHYPDNLLSYIVSSGYELAGWNNGAIGDGYHIIPAMTQYNIVQANGATTFIGNDILQPFLIQGSQMPGAANFASESSFSDTNHSQPYTQERYVLKNLLQNSTGTAEMWASVSVDFSSGHATSTDPAVIVLAGTGTGRFMKFVLFEIDYTNTPVQDPITHRYQYIEILKIDLPDTSGADYVLPGSQAANDGATNGHFDNINTPVSITLNYDKVYVLGMICDADGGAGSSMYCSFLLSALDLTLKSRYEYGAGPALAAPSLNASSFPAFSLKSLWQKLVPCLGAATSNAYGFPDITPDIPYEGVSDFLASTEEIADCAPAQIRLTSAYCIHDLQGQSYISCSVSQFFNFCKKVLGAGLAINLANPNQIEIEKLSTYFDKDTMILDLGDNVSKMKVRPFQDFAGVNLKLGYAKADTNADFGVDSFITELFFNTPATNIPNKTIDLEVGDVVVDQYAIEKSRAQRVSQPVGESFDPANPSKDNQLIALYCERTATGRATIYKPDNTPDGFTPYPVQQFAHAQNYDPTAVAGPYINGLYYPDTAINIPLSPCRALQRDGGALLHSALKAMDGQKLTFRNSSVMQYNNVALALSGISSNLNAGSAPVVEFADKEISDLPDALFAPYLIDLETVSPVNMYEIMTTNPNGYIKWQWKGITWKGFIWIVDQHLTLSQPTNYQLIAHPETSDYMLQNS